MHSGSGSWTKAPLVLFSNEGCLTKEFITRHVHLQGCYLIFVMVEHSWQLGTTKTLGGGMTRWPIQLDDQTRHQDP